MLTVKFKRLPHAGTLPLPAYQTEGAAGMDLRAALPHVIQLRPRERYPIPTGFAIEIPAGYEGQVRARSGLAVKQGLALCNGVGSLDSDYRGEVFVAAINLGEDYISIEPGQRIAQLMIVPVVRATVAEVAELSETARGAGGFGSTGT